MANDKSLLDEKGILPIVSVPFLSSEELDPDGFLRTVAYIEGTDAIGMVLFGIASEFYKLSDSEREQLVGMFLGKRSTKLKVISVTAHATFHAVRLARQYEKMGADALMLLPPFFLSPAKELMLAHIESVASAVSIPIILQIASGETGVSYSKQELLRLHRKYPHLIFKIEGNPAPSELIGELLQEASELVVFNGYAGIFMTEMLKLGCSGIMPGCSFTEIYCAIYKQFSSGNWEQAEQLHRRLCLYIQPWMSHCEYIIQIEKYILKLRGVLQSDQCRAPGYGLSEKDFSDVRKFLSEYQEFLVVQ